MADLTKLKEITKELEELVYKQTDGFIRYNIAEPGECFGFNMYHTDEIALQRAFMMKGSYFEEHIHKDEKEILIVYKGKLEGKVDGKVRIIDTGDCEKVDKGIPHSWRALEDTWMIGITIPASGAYPYG